MIHKVIARQKQFGQSHCGNDCAAAPKFNNCWFCWEKWRIKSNRRQLYRSERRCMPVKL